MPIGSIRKIGSRKKDHKIVINTQTFWWRHLTIADGRTSNIQNRNYDKYMNEENFLFISFFFANTNRYSVGYRSN